MASLPPLSPDHLAPPQLNQTNHLIQANTASQSTRRIKKADASHLPLLSFVY